MFSNSESNENLAQINNKLGLKNNRLKQQNLLKVNYVNSNKDVIMMMKPPDEPQLDKLPDCFTKQRKTNKIY